MIADAQPAYRADESAVHPTIRTLRVADLLDALRKGFEDFKAKRSDIVFLALIYPIVGLALMRFTLGLSLLPLLFPLVAGFALVGPVAALGFCELSRQREQGVTPSWAGTLHVLRQASIGDIVTLGLLHAIIFVAWMAAAWAIYTATMGGEPPVSAMAFMRDVLTTSEGWALIVLGNGVGFLFAATVLCISCVSFPMLLDRHVNVLTAIRTSVRTVMANPVTMAVWGLIVAVSLMLGTVIFLLGLAVAVPVLGHATWHIYRKAVAD